MNRTVQDLVRRIQSLSDDDLCDELRMIVNDARFNPAYNRDFARVIGDECRKRGILKPNKALSVTPPDQKCETPSAGKE